MASMKFIYKKTIVVAVTAIGFISFAAKLVIFYMLMGISPHTPNQASGQVYELNNHGDIVFITKGQDAMQYVLMGAAVVFWIAAWLLNNKWKVLRSYELPKHIQ